MGDKMKKREVRKTQVAVREGFSLMTTMGLDPDLVTEGDMAHIVSLSSRITKVEMTGYDHLVVTISPETDNPATVQALRVKIRGMVSTHLRAILNRQNAVVRAEVSAHLAVHPVAYD